jgi:CHASE2 domain-containing sensor protein
MAEEPTPTLADKSLSAVKRQLSKLIKGSLTKPLHQSKLVVRFGHLLTGISVFLAAILSAANGSRVQLLENQALTTFFQMSGMVVAPQDIVILAIDDQSISIAEQYYKTDPQQYAYLKPIKSFPYQGAAYAQVITKLINASARSVNLNIVLDQSSVYCEADEHQLQAVLRRYGRNVTLAPVYDNFTTHQGLFQQLTQPQPIFRLGAVSIGAVNFPLELDGKIHRLSSEFSPLSDSSTVFNSKMPSFKEPFLAAAQVNYSQGTGDHIYFWGNGETFRAIPLWYLFDPENWNNYLEQGQFFQNEIVLIGAIEKLSDDDHRVAVSPRDTMAGVEIYANAIPTLMGNKSIATAIRSPLWRGLFVLLLVSGSSMVVTIRKEGIQRFLLSIALAGVWGGISYTSFIYGKLMFPTTIPIIAIALTGLSYLGT